MTNVYHLAKVLISLLRVAKKGIRTNKWKWQTYGRRKSNQLSIRHRNAAKINQLSHNVTLRNSLHAFQLALVMGKGYAVCIKTLHAIQSRYFRAFTDTYGQKLFISTRPCPTNQNHNAAILSF